MIPVAMRASSSTNLLPVLGLILSACVSQCSRYQGAQLVRVTRSSAADIERLSAMEDFGDIEVIATTSHTSDVLVLNATAAKLMRALDGMNATHEVLLGDVQAAIDEEAAESAEAATATSLRAKPCDYGPCFDWQSYHRAASIVGYLDSLRTAEPRVTVAAETVGRSAEGRPLRLVKISSGNGSHPGAVWLDGGTHAREWITPSAAAYVAGRVVASLRAGHPDFAGLEYYVLPLANPDGYEYSHTDDRFWRKNRSGSNKGGCVGADLNRNWGHRWGGPESSQRPCSPNYRGARPFSEPETRAVSAYILKRKSQIKAYLSLHSYGQGILFPWGYTYSAPPDHQDLSALARAMAKSVKKNGAEYKYGTASQMYYIASAAVYPMMGPRGGCTIGFGPLVVPDAEKANGYSHTTPALRFTWEAFVSGGSQDWAKGTAKIKYAYTMELRDTGKYGFVLPISQIVPASVDAFEAFKVLITKIKAER